MNFYIYNANKILDKIESIHGNNLNPKNSTKNRNLYYKYIKFFDGASSYNSWFMEKLKAMKSLDGEFYIVPISINIPSDSYIGARPMLQSMIDSLSFYKTYPDKHVFFFVGDDSHHMSELKGIIFQTSCDKNSSNLPLHYSSRLVIPKHKPIIEAKFVVSFRGCVNCDLRRKLKNQIHAMSASFEEHCGDNHSNNPEAEFKFLNSILNSKFVLCPKGKGLNSIRFFETLACGRIPILISDQIKLPLRSIIDYSKFVIHVPESQISNLGAYIDKFEKENNLAKASTIAINTWNTWFNSNKFIQFLEASLDEANRNNIRKRFV